MPYMIADEDG